MRENDFADFSNNMARIFAADAAQNEVVGFPVV